MSDFDLIIIGGGPAGLTAGLYAARANMNAVLFEGKDVGGEILNTELIEDYPGFESVTGTDLSAKMADHARKFGLRIETYTPVKKIRSEGDRKIIELEDGTTHTAYAVIVTVGGEPTKLGGDEAGVKWVEVEQDGETKRVPVEGVFIFVGFKPVGRHLFQEHIDHDENGYLITDQFMRTNIPGVYAAGDTRAQLAKQITTAVGDATTAVLHAERYIGELKHMCRSFPDVPSETLEREVERMKLRRYLAGQTIIRDGDRADSFFVLTQGAASVRRNGPDGEREISTLKAGDFFGEVGLLTGAPRNATVRATAPSEVLELDAEGFRDLVESSQATKDRVRSSMTERLAKAGPKS